MDLVRTTSSGVIHRPDCRVAKRSGAVPWKYAAGISDDAALTAQTVKSSWLHLCTYCLTRMCQCQKCSKPAPCTKESGTCQKCQSYCQHKPGWFMPGEAEKAAELMGVPFDQFFREWLAVDWWQDSPDIFVLAPAIVGEEPGTEYPVDPRGTCVFFTEGRCQIHAAKPFECRDAVCTDTDPSSAHGDVADAWRMDEHQAQIRELLGREPEAEEWEGGGIWSWL